MHCKKIKLILFLLNLLIWGSFSSIWAENSIKNKLVVFHAGSLSVPFKMIEENFEKSYVNIDILRESSGSRLAARKVSELNRQADIVAVSDYDVILDILMPKYTDWYLCFACNQMVIMYDKHSKYAQIINSSNWPKILLKKGVDYGYSDPNLDPCGYRSLFVWQLAEKYYQIPGLYEKLSQNCPSKNIRPKETDLIALVEAGELDYIFNYRSVATQHNFPFIELPDAINLSTSKFKDYYKKASMKVSGKKPGTYSKVRGTPIFYALTIPKNAKNKKAAYKFIEYLLSEEGRGILVNCGQPPIVPATINKLKHLPSELNSLLIKGLIEIKKN
ncbi:MAG: tungstate ABC transporter substrate-binding protein WtpA [bacterium]|nr:tungstate ABC transporter substrate-binding protein WtpA [bacterium]